MKVLHNADAGEDPQSGWVGSCLRVDSPLGAIEVAVRHSKLSSRRCAEAEKRMQDYINAAMSSM